MPSTITDRLNGLTTSVAVKAPCRAATTANITLSGEQTIDGVAVVSGDRVLVKNQTTATENGIYVAATSAWSRSTDFDGSLDVVGGTWIKVNSGTVNADSYWRVEGDGQKLPGTDSITFETTSGNLTLQDDLASADGGKGAALVSTEAGVTAQDWFDRWKDTRDFGTNALTKANFILSQPDRTEGYELDARQTGALFDFNRTAQTGTDDSGALQEGIDWLSSKGGGELRLPWTSFAGGAKLDSTLTIPEGVALVGAAGGMLNTTTALVGNMTGEPVIHVTGNSAGLRNLLISATDTRWAEATSSVDHGVFVSGGDSATTHLCSRQRFENVYVLRQPGDGWHFIGSLELSRLADMWAVSCKRHGLAWDDGTRAGYTNKELAAFMVRLARFRAMDCGGNAILLGQASETNHPLHVILDHPEALGCGWDTSAREYLEQIYVRGQDIWIMQPDVEDQQYANSTLTNTGDSKTSRATPSGGIRGHGGVYLKLVGGHYSSIMNCLVVGASSVVDIDVTGAGIGQGAYATDQAVAFDLSAGSIIGSFRGRTASVPATKYLDCRATAMQIEVNGNRYRPTTSSAINIGLYDGDAPQSATISGGVLTATSLNVLVVGEGNSADTLNTFRYLSGLNGVGGHVLRLHYGAQDITISNAGDFLFKDGETSLTLDASYPVATFVYNSATTKWVEQ